MAFSGKATYSAGATLPEIAEDLSDLVSINSAHETALLDALGDPARPARSTVHEWIEDELLPQRDAVDDDTFGNALTDTTFGVANASRFRVGDEVRVEGAGEVMLVTAVSVGGGTITVVRGYGGTTAASLEDELVLHIIGNASLEGDDAATPRFASRSRKSNYTQIFAATVEVSGSELAAKQIGIADELDYQKEQRSRELLRELENSVINGVLPAANPQGSSTVRRTMRGLLSFISTNRFTAGSGGFPSDVSVTEEQINLALRTIWKESAGNVDLIVVGGAQKRQINQFIASNRRFTSESEKLKSLLSVYESDFGVCRIVMSRAVPTGTVLLLDSSRIEVLPLSGRSFHYKPLASTGDRETGQMIGEYTLELRNENAHGVIDGLEA